MKLDDPLSPAVTAVSYSTDPVTSALTFLASFFMTRVGAMQQKLSTLSAKILKRAYN